MVTELFITRGIKSNISFVFITQSQFASPKDLKPNSKIFFSYRNSKQKITSANRI